MNYIIDYLTISVKPDLKSDKPLYLDFNDFVGITGFLNVFNNFVDIGQKRFYEHCYTYNCVDIKVPRADKFESQGYLLSMSGQGCRYLESLSTYFSWEEYLNTFRELTKLGCKVNIARLDFAFDEIIYKDEDKTPLLCLENIEKFRSERLFVSLYRRSDSQIHDDFVMKTSIYATLVKDKISKTIYFGSRKSNSFCRFYDKLIEQQQKFKNNPVEFEEINKKNIAHWVRFEIVFKNSTALKIVNSMLELPENKFNSFLSETINYYLCFINNDDDNRYKCSVVDWWANFLGTIKKAKLKCEGIKKNVLKRSVEWLARSVFPTLKAVKRSVGTFTLLGMINEFGNYERWKKKHFEIVECNTYDEEKISNEKYWRSLIPIFCNEKSDNDNIDFNSFEDFEIISCDEDSIDGISLNDCQVISWGAYRECEV